MTQTLKTLINTVAAEVYELQDTKADRIELNAYVRIIDCLSQHRSKLLRVYAQDVSSLDQTDELWNGITASINPGIFGVRRPDICI